jgi:hypothetical protein
VGPTEHAYYPSLQGKSSLQYVVLNKITERWKMSKKVNSYINIPSSEFSDRIYWISIVTLHLKVGKVEAEETLIAKQRLGKQFSASTGTRTTMVELLGTMFSVRSLQSCNKREELGNWFSVGSRAVKRRLYMYCSTVIFGVCNSERLL